MERGKKRKRDVENPRITYHVSTRTFDRLFKEESLAEMKAVVRRKLALSSTTPLLLAQMREGRAIDLEDDDDFDAFCAVAHSTSLVSVQVTIKPDAAAPGSSILEGTIGVGESGPPVISDMSSAEAHNDALSSDTTKPRKHSVSFAALSGGNGKVAEGLGASPKKKRRKKNKAITTGNVGNSVGGGSNRSETTPNALENPVELNTSAISLHAQNTGDTTQLSYSQGDSRNTSESKNVRRKRKRGFQPEPSMVAENRNSENDIDNIIVDKSLPSLDNSRQESSQIRQVGFAQDLAEAITKTTELNQNVSEKEVRKNRTVRTGKEAKKGKELGLPVSPASIEEESSKDKKAKESGKSRVTGNTNDSALAIRKVKPKPRRSGADDLEALNADVKAAFSRIMASKRALLNTSGQASEQSVSDVVQQPVLSSSAILYRMSDVEVPPSKNISEGSSNKTVEVLVRPLRHPTRRTKPETFPRAAQSSLSQKESPARSSLPHQNCPDLKTIGTKRRTSEGNASFRSTIAPLSLGDCIDVSLEAIIRGPTIPVSVAHIESDESSEEEAELILEEDEVETRHSRRPKRRDADSSESETGSDDRDSSTGSNELQTVASTPPDSVAPGTSFHVVDRSGLSQNVDVSGSAAFEDVFEEENIVMENLNVATLAVGNLRKSVDHEHTDRRDDADTTGSAETPATSSFPQKTEHISSGSEEAPQREVLAVPRKHGIVQGMKTRSRRALESTESASATVRKDVGAGGDAAPQTKSARMLGLMTPPPFLLLTSAKNNRLTSRPARKLMTRPSENTLQVDEKDNAMASISELAVKRPLTETLSPKSSLQTPQSSNTWAVLKASSPALDTEPTLMIDELQSSSPSSYFQPGEVANVTSPAASVPSSPKDSLFILTESQTPFPYSQWATINSQHDQRTSNESDDEEEVEATMQLPSISTGTFNQYRKLTEIAGSQEALFSTPPIVPLSVSCRPNKHKLSDMYGRNGKADDTDSDTGSDTDSNPSGKSHIPDSRRAGVIRTPKIAKLLNRTD